VGPVDYITLQDLIFENITVAGMQFYLVRYADVRDCTFIGSMQYGILDQQGAGNEYNNIEFDGQQTVNLSLGEYRFPAPMTIDRLEIQ
jgi:hypothetical protein